MPILPWSQGINVLKPNIPVGKDYIILADQVRNIHYKNRNTQITGSIDGKVLLEALNVIAQILGIK